MPMEFTRSMALADTQQGVNICVRCFCCERLVSSFREERVFTDSNQAQGGQFELSFVITEFCAKPRLRESTA